MLGRWFVLTLLFTAEASLAQFDQYEAMETRSPSPKLEVDRGDLQDLGKAKESGSEEGLIQAASKILGKDQNHLVALNALAVFYIEKGKPGLAKLILNRALESHPDSSTLHNNLGVVYMSEGEVKRAIKSFKRAVELKSTYRPGLANLGSIYVEYGDYNRALAPLETGYRDVRSELKTGKDYVIEVSNNYAVALVGAGEFSKAQSIYKEVLDAQSRNTEVLMNYAILLTKHLKDAGEARRAISRLKFVASDPKIVKKTEELERLLETMEK